MTDLRAEIEEAKVQLKKANEYADSLAMGDCGYDDTGYWRGKLEILERWAAEREAEEDDEGPLEITQESMAAVLGGISRSLKEPK